MGDSKKIAQVRSARQVPAYVRLLDDEVFHTGIDKRAVGWILFDKVCENLNILEKDFFGLTYIDATGVKNWLNNDKKISKQLKAQKWEMTFEVKFYPPDPAQLAEDLTRYQLCLQIRRDLVNEKLPGSFVTYTLLGSYTAQSEIGDYDPEEFGSGYKYLKEIQFAPRQDKDLLMKIAEIHRQHKGQTPEEAELHFLENAQKLAMYGVELHAAMDAEGKEISLGVSATGLTVYKDKQQINRFVWPKVLKISYRRNKYYIKIRPGEFETFASLIGFKLAHIKAAKRLWKISVEHHSFFRFREPEPTKSVSILPRFGSRFRYSGRTQFQTRQVVSEENRDSPFFERVMSKRGTFAGRTTNMKRRDEDRRQLREDMRRQPISPAQPQVVSRQEPKHAHSEPRHPPPPLPNQPPPEPRRAPPIAPKPKPRGSMDSIDKIDRVELAPSANQSFDEEPDRRSRMEKIHAVATPLAAVMAKQHEEIKKRDAESLHSSHGPPGYSSDDPEDLHEERNERPRTPESRPYTPESRPYTPEVIDQDVAIDPVMRPPMSEKEKKQFAKQEKERLKHEKEEEKRRKKEEEREKKRLEKEKKALMAQEKKAASKMSKQKGKEPKREITVERKDSKNSNDIGRDWDNVREQDGRGPVTPDRTRKRLSSFEDIKREVERERDEDDRPPTPPAPLPVGKNANKMHRDHSNSNSSEYDSSEDRPKHGGRDDDFDDDEDPEEVSF